MTPIPCLHTRAQFIIFYVCNKKPHNVEDCENCLFCELYLNAFFFQLLKQPVPVQFSGFRKYAIITDAP